MPDSPLAEGRGPVFVSFASEDLELATRIRDALESAGIRCWMAPRDLEPGVSFPAAITAAISSCGAALLLLTDSSNASPHVLSEIELAFSARKPILAVRPSAVEPSANLRYFISITQWFDVQARFDDDDAVRLRTQVEKLLAGEQVGGGVRPHWMSAWRLPILAALTIAVVLASYFLFRDNSRDKGAVEGAGSIDEKPSTEVPTRTGSQDGQIYAWVPPGQFTMGCSAGDPACEKDEMPAHAVIIRNGFWLAKSEVTVAQYKKVVAEYVAPPDAEGSLPVVGVPWAQAKAYCAAVGGRLPSEAEWEYAARAGTSGRYYDTLAAIAWYVENSDDRPHAVASRQPNAFGLHDMLGNVYEWVLDRYYNAYDDASEVEAVEEPLAPNASAVARGGSWASEDSALRVSNRLEMPPDAEEVIIGFRCAQAENE